MKRLILILTMIIAAASTLTAQNSSSAIDSLVKEAMTAADTAQARLYNNVAWKLRYSDPHQAIHLAQIALEIAKGHNQPEQCAMSFGVMGICSKNLGEYDKAVKFYEEAHGIRVKYANTEELAYSNINLANIYINLNDPDKARTYVDDIARDLDKINKKEILAYYHLNYGRILTMKAKYDSAYTELNLALKLRQEINAPRSSVLSTLRLLAELQTFSGDTFSAIDNYRIIIRDSSQIDRPMFVDVYNSMANILLNRARYDSADYYARKALAIADSLDAKQKKERIYGTIGMINYRQRKYVKAAEWFERKINLGNEIYGDALNQNLISAKATAEKTKKDAEISKLDEENRVQQALNTAFGILLSTIIILLIIFIVYNRKTRNLHRRLDEQEKSLDESNSKITASLNYARRIQQSAVSEVADVAEIFPDSMVFYKPRDIVSGDWYRVETRRGYKIIVEADCTGHGVPGSLLSMMGMSALKDILNDIDNSGEEFDPAIILSRMRIMVKTMLLQVDDSGMAINDGMDMSIGVIDPKTNIMRFGSAYQMAILVRNGECIKIKGDRQPIGNYIREKDFTSQEIQLQKGDSLFFMSDGIKDQTSPSPRMEKFKGPRLDDFLLKNIHLPMKQIGENLMTTIEAWRDGSLQMDDMTMVGVRID
ncbi:MAG: SpoIIE family protein phosphatase [Bacteroidales bacterium]|nr:SpoIIE family protein phosphatase [Bacteroidales bacterium]